MTKPIALGLAILYGLLAVAHNLVLTGDVRTIMFSFATFSSLLTLSIFLFSKSKSFFMLFNPHLVIETLISVGVANSMLHQILMPEPHHSTNLILSVLAGSMVMWRRRAVTAIIILTWVHLYYVASIGAPSPLWLHFGFGIVIAQFVGVLNFIIRRRSLVRFETLRLEQQRATDLYQSGQSLMAIGEVAAVMAHEINNPLAIASMQLQTLERQEKLSEFLPSLHRAQRALTRIGGLVANLREATRESDGGSFGRHPIEKVIQKIKENYAPILAASSIEFKLVTPSFEGWCYMRTEHVEFIIRKLMDNAIDAARDGSNPWIELGFDKTKHKGSLMIRIWVANSGREISRNTRSKIFTPLFTTKEMASGRGLSLSVAQARATAMRGQLYLDAKPSPTTFVLLLPMEISEHVDSVA